MKILEKINDINNKAIFSGIGFLTMGATATVIGSPLVGAIGLGSLGLSLAYIFSESINKYRIKSKKYNPVKTSLLPQVYQMAFTNHLDNYIYQSQNDVERKYKIILTSFALKQIGIDPSTLMNDAFGKSYEWCEKYNILSPDGKMVDLFGRNNSHVNYKELTQEDFKDPIKLTIAQEVYKDFAHLGLLGKEVSRIFGFHPSTEFLLTLHSYQLNEADLNHIQRATEKIMKTPSYKRRMNQPARNKEENFIFDIIESNPMHIKTLHQFHTEVHCYNGMCSYPKLIEFINDHLQILQTKEKLDDALYDKAPIKAKPKKI